MQARVTLLAYWNPRIVHSWCKQQSLALQNSTCNKWVSNVNQEIKQWANNSRGPQVGSCGQQSPVTSTPHPGSRSHSFSLKGHFSTRVLHITPYSEPNHAREELVFSLLRKQVNLNICPSSPSRAFLSIFMCRVLMSPALETSWKNKTLNLQIKK